MPKKKAIIVSSCAAPGIMGRYVYSTQKQLKATVKVVGGRVVGSIFTGMIADEPHAKLPQRVQARLVKLAAKIS